MCPKVINNHNNSKKNNESPFFFHCSLECDHILYFVAVSVDRKKRKWEASKERVLFLRENVPVSAYLISWKRQTNVSENDVKKATKSRKPRLVYYLHITGRSSNKACVEDDSHKSQRSSTSLDLNTKCIWFVNSFSKRKPAIQLNQRSLTTQVAKL